MLAVHADAIVFISRVWQTTCIAVRGGEEGFVIDSPVYPDELAALPGVMEAAGFPVSGLLATHADWDHLLGRLAFPSATLGCGESTVTRLAAEPGDAQRQMRAFDEEHYVDGRHPLGLGGIQSLAVPGRVAIGGAGGELELIPATGHTADGTAFRLPWLQLLCCGDYLSPVEIPMISPGGSLPEYVATLERLEPLVREADTVIPGHGGPIDRTGALRVLDEDLKYLNALAIEGADAALPASRRAAPQRRVHERNVERLISAADHGQRVSRSH